MMDKNTFTLLVKKLDGTDKDIESLRMDIAALRGDISSLNNFKSRIYGMCSFIVIGLTLIINYFKA